MDHRFQINLRGVIDLLSEHLYSSPDVFVRELLQNGVDAITARESKHTAFEPEIRVECHAPKGKQPSIVFTDNGVGLTAAEVHRFLATIGLSSKKAADGKRTGDFLGQFGIGILACFVVSEEIVLITKSAVDPGAKAVEWRAKADGTYSVKELERDFEPGTQVWLTAKEGAGDLFEAENVKRLCKRFGGLLPFPIRVSAGRGTTHINADPPPWRQEFKNEKEGSRALLKFGKDTFGVPFFDAIPLASAVGKVDGVAFVLPFEATIGGKKQHRVYLKNMLLSESADNLLPDWAVFVTAVVNADDLRPTAGRESFYEDAKLAKVRTALGEAVRNYLIDLAENKPEKLQKFLALHHRPIKALAAEDDEFFADVVDLLPFETTLGRMPFGEYRQQTDVIRYVADVDAFRQVSGVAAAQGLCVINAGYAYDADLVRKAGEAFPFLSVEALDPEGVAQAFDDLSFDEEQHAHGFLKLADVALKPFKVSTAAKRFAPEDLPVMFTADREGRFFRSVEQTKEVSDALWSGLLGSLAKRDGGGTPANGTLTFNFRNPVVLRLATMPDKARVKTAVQLLYCQALLLGHHPLTQQEMAAMNGGLLGLLDLL